MDVIERWTAACVGVVLLACMASAAFASAEGEIRALLANNDLGRTGVSIFAVDLEHHDVLAEIDADEPRIPASNMKLLTTAAALGVLGPDYAFRTELRIMPAEAQDTYPGLLVVGDGDPAFGDPVLLARHEDSLVVDDLLNAWCDAAADTGHPRFARLVIDDRVFDREYVHPTWPEDQLINYWCAPVSGLNFYTNVVDVLPIPARNNGEAPRVEIFPDSPRLTTRNRATTGNRSTFWVGRPQGTNEFTFHGIVEQRPAEPYEFTVDDPPMVFGELLRARLRARGIEVGEVVRPRGNERFLDSQPLHIIRTTLPLIIERTNTDSQNLFAEALYKRMGQELTGRPGSFENGAAAVRSFLSEPNRLGTDATAMQIADGSGMSRDNRVTARGIVRLLASMWDDEPLRTPYINSLALAGRDEGGEYFGNGTLNRRTRRFDTLPEGVWVRGKSGYLNGTSALSGYAILPSGRGVAFSFLFNDYRPPVNNRQLKALQEAMVAALVEEVMQDEHAAAP